MCPKIRISGHIQSEIAAFLFSFRGWKAGSQAPYHDFSHPRLPPRGSSFQKPCFFADLLFRFLLGSGCSFQTGANPFGVSIFSRYPCVFSRFSPDVTVCTLDLIVLAICFLETWQIMSGLAQAEIKSRILRSTGFRLWFETQSTGISTGMEMTWPVGIPFHGCSGLKGKGSLGCFKKNRP